MNPQQLLIFFNSFIYVIQRDEYTAVYAQQEKGNLNAEIAPYLFYVYRCFANMYICFHAHAWCPRRSEKEH